MLRKLIMFAITSGLAGKAWRYYRDNRRSNFTARYTPGVRPTVSRGTGGPATGKRPVGDTRPAEDLPRV